MSPLVILSRLADCCQSMCDMTAESKQQCVSLWAVRIHNSTACRICLLSATFATQGRSKTKSCQVNVDNLLCCAVLCCAVLCCAVLCCAALCYKLAEAIQACIQASMSFLLGITAAHRAHVWSVDRPKPGTMNQKPLHCEGRSSNE